MKKQITQKPFLALDDSSPKRSRKPMSSSSISLNLALVVLLAPFIFLFMILSGDTSGMGGFVVLIVGIPMWIGAIIFGIPLLLSAYISHRKESKERKSSGLQLSTIIKILIILTLLAYTLYLVLIQFI